MKPRNRRLALGLALVGVVGCAVGLVIAQPGLQPTGQPQMNQPIPATAPQLQTPPAMPAQPSMTPPARSTSQVMQTGSTSAPTETTSPAHVPAQPRSLP